MVSNASDWQSQASRLLTEAEALFEGADLEQSAKRYQTAMKLLEEHRATTDEQWFKCLSQLGAIYYALADYQKAIDIYSRLAVEMEQQKGERDVDTITAIYKVGKACQQAGMNADARAMYQRARHLGQQVLPENHFLLRRIRDSFNELIELPRWKKTLHKMVAADTKQAQAIKGAARFLHPGRQHMVLGTTVLCLLVSATMAIVMFQKMVPQSRISVASGAMGGEDGPPAFKTAGNYAELAVLKDELQLKLSGRVEKIPYHLVSGPDPGTLFQVIFGKHQLWINKSGQSLALEDGTMFFGPATPETQLTDLVLSISQRANKYYQKIHSYPGPPSKFFESAESIYINPFTGQKYMPVFQWYYQTPRLETIVDGASGTNDVIRKLAGGALWRQEVKPMPGAIHVLTQSNGNESFEGKYFMGDMFIHAFGDDALPLSTGVPGQKLVVHLHQGWESHPSKELRSDAGRHIEQLLKNKNVFLADSEQSRWIQQLRHFVPVLLFTALIIGVLWWLSGDMRNRVESPASSLRLSEMTLGAITLILIIWYAYCAL